MDKEENWLDSSKFASSSSHGLFSDDSPRGIQDLGESTGLGSTVYSGVEPKKVCLDFCVSISPDVDISNYFDMHSFSLKDKQEGSFSSISTSSGKDPYFLWPRGSS